MSSREEDGWMDEKQALLLYLTGDPSCKIPI